MFQRMVVLFWCSVSLYGAHVDMDKLVRHLGPNQSQVHSDVYNAMRPEIQCLCRMRLMQIRSDWIRNVFILLQAKVNKTNANIYFIDAADLRNPGIYDCDPFPNTLRRYPLEFALVEIVGFQKDMKEFELLKQEHKEIFDSIPSSYVSFFKPKPLLFEEIKTVVDHLFNQGCSPLCRRITLPLVAAAELCSDGDIFKKVLSAYAQKANDQGKIENADYLGDLTQALFHVSSAKKASLLLKMGADGDRALKFAASVTRVGEDVCYEPNPELLTFLIQGGATDFSKKDKKGKSCKDYCKEDLRPDSSKAGSLKAWECLCIMNDSEGSCKEDEEFKLPYLIFKEAVLRYLTDEKDFLITMMLKAKGLCTKEERVVRFLKKRALSLEALESEVAEYLKTEEVLEPKKSLNVDDHSSLPVASLTETLSPVLAIDHRSS